METRNHPVSDHHASWNRYDYAGATAIGVVMLAASFLLLLIDQPLAMVEPPLRGGIQAMAVSPQHFRSDPRRVHGRPLTTESPLSAALLIGTAVAT